MHNRISWQRGLIVVIALLGSLFGRTTVLQAQDNRLIMVRDEQGEYPLGRRVDYLEDVAGNLTIEEVSGPAFNGRFQPSQQDVPNFGFTQSVYWFRLRIQVETQQPSIWWLEINNAGLNRLDLYIPDGQNNRFIRQQTGSIVPHRPQTSPHRLPVFALDLTPGVAQTIYLRVEENAALTLPITLFANSAFVNNIQNERIFLGLNFGILLVMLIYNFILFFFLRQRSYLYYVAFIASYMLAQASGDGLGRQYLWPNAGQWNDQASFFFTPLTMIAFLYFTDEFLQTQQHVPGFHQLKKILVTLWTLLFLFIPFVSLRLVTPPLLLLILISAVAAIATSFLAWRRAYQPARYFFIAWSIPLMGAIIFALAQFGILPLNIVTQQSPRLGLVFMVSLLSVALADQINIIRRQREDALVRVERLNQDLEGRVAVRTAELETSNRHLTEVIVDLEWAETALKQQALQLEALRQIALEIAGELELPVLLQSVVFHAVELMRTRRGSLFLWQPEREVLEMVTTTAEPVVDVGTTLRSGEGLTGQVWASGKPMMTNNYRQWPGRVEAIAKRIQPTAILGVPIVWHDERMGVLIIADHSDRNFVDEDVQLLKLFATQAAVAIQNGRLLAQVQNHTQVLEAEIFERRQAQDALQHYRGHLEELVEARTNELEVANRQLAQHNRVLLTLHAASLAVTSSLNLQEVLNTVTHEMAQLLDITICDVLTWDRQARTITIVAGYRLSGQLIEEEFETYDLSRYCLSEQVLLEKFVAQMTISQPDLDPGEREYMQAAGTKTLLMMPILFHNHSIGMITLEDQNVERTFTEEEIGLAQLFSYQAANAIENARHYAQAQQLIAELEVKNAELEQFTYIVSHDLKSPLITVKGFLGFLEKDAFHGDMGKVKQDIERIRDATMKMEQLLNDLLELSRIGRLVNPPQPVPFHVLAEEAVKLVAGPIAAGGVQVKIAPDMAVVYVDRVRVVEALQNLTDNAVKFMGDQAKPVIDIGVENGDDEPIFFVRDNGIGIEPKYHDKVFGLFDRLDSAVAGTGIGLALVKRIIEVHNGRIWIESDGNKNGTTIYFTLPTTANQQED